MGLLEDLFTKLIMDIQTNPQDLILFITLIITIIIGFISILLTAYTLKEQRKHARLSIRPIGGFDFYSGKDGIKISISNNGIGPMLIKKIDIIDENGISKNELSNFFPKNWLVDWIPPGTEGQISSINELENHSLIAGDKYVCYEIIFDPHNPLHTQKVREIRNVFKTLTFKMKYNNIYGEEQPEVIEKFGCIIEQ